MGVSIYHTSEACFRRFFSFPFAWFSLSHAGERVAGVLDRMAFNDFCFYTSLHHSRSSNPHCALSCVYAAAAAMNGNAGFESLDDVIGRLRYYRPISNVLFCLLSFALWCSTFCWMFGLAETSFSPCIFSWVVDFDAFFLFSGGLGRLNFTFRGSTGSVVNASPYTTCSTSLCLGTIGCLEIFVFPTISHVFPKVDFDAFLVSLFWTFGQPRSISISFNGPVDNCCVLHQ